MILKHRDRELLRFEWTGARGVRVLSVNDAERKFLPIDMFGQVTDESLWKWISSRTVPWGRRYILAVLRQLGISSDDIRAIVEFSRGLSLNDVYWVVDDSFSGSWKDYNLYDNEFSDDTNGIVGPAPIFDNGYGLFALATDRPDMPQYHEFDDLRKYLNRVGPALYDCWLDYPEKLTTDLLSKLTQLRGFQFKKHKHYNLNDDRLSAIEEFIQKRVAGILEHGKTADRRLVLQGVSVGKNPKNAQFETDEKCAAFTKSLHLSKDSVGIKSTFIDSLGYQILSNMKADQYITAAEIAEILQVEQRTVERKIKVLRERGIIERIGSRKAGYWQVNEIY